MKVIKEEGKIVAYRHWFKWYFSGHIATQFMPKKEKTND